MTNVICVWNQNPQKHTCKPILNKGTKFLSLTHNNLSDLKTMTRRGKRYNITFINDLLRYTKLYIEKYR